MAKHLCMMTRTKQSHEIRTYFILMEKAVKKMINWAEVRHPEIEGYKVMASELKKQYMDTHNQKEPPKFIYANNANMLNRALFGYTSKQMKQIIGEKVEYVDSLRDNLQVEANKALYELQMLNTSLIISNMDYQSRKKIIENTCKAKFSNLKVNINNTFAKELQRAS